MRARYGVYARGLIIAGCGAGRACVGERSDGVVDGEVRRGEGILVGLCSGCGSRTFFHRMALE